MSGLIALLALFGTAGAMLGLIVRHRRSYVRQIFAHNAPHMGLTVERSGVRAAGETSGVALTLRVDGRPGRELIASGRPGWPKRGYYDGHEDPSLLARGVLPLSLPLSVNRGPSGVAGHLGEKAWRHADTGDDVFDRRVRVQGPEDETRAMLDASLRAVLQAFADRGGTFDGRTLELGWRAFADPNTNVAGFESLRSAAVELLRVAPAADDPVRAMADVATDDPIAGVRRACLLRLFAAHPAHAETHRAATRTLYDDDVALQVLAATHLGASAHLLRLLDPALGPEINSRAVEGLARTADDRQALRARLDRLTPVVRQHAVRLLVEHGDLEVGGLSLAQADGGGLTLAGEVGALAASGGSTFDEPAYDGAADETLAPGGDPRAE